MIEMIDKKILLDRVNEFGSELTKEQVVELINNMKVSVIIGEHTEKLKVVDAITGKVMCEK